MNKKDKMIHVDEDKNEIDIIPKDQTVVINVGADQIITINKLFGSLIFDEIRITPVSETCTWKIEKQVIDPDTNIFEWVTVFEFDGQDDDELEEDY